MPDFMKVKHLRATLSVSVSVVMLACQLLVFPLSKANATPTPPPLDNGIHVGQTKFYDERSLALMLQSTQAKLANRDFFDQGSIAAAIGKMQGARLDTSSFGFNVTTNPLPSVATTTNTGSTTTFNEQTTQPSTPAGQTPALPGVVTTNNVVTPNTVSQVVTQPSVTPSPAALPSQTSAFAYQPPFSLAPQTLLAQQMELTHDLENLRLLLEGSITDRVINLPIYVNGQSNATFSGARSRAIAGFQISLDSLKSYENAVAEVEITITSGNTFNAITGQAQPAQGIELSYTIRQLVCNSDTTIRQSAFLLGFLRNVLLPRIAEYHLVSLSSHTFRIQIMGSS